MQEFICPECEKLTVGCVFRKKHWGMCVDCLNRLRAGNDLAFEGMGKFKEKTQ